MHNIKLSFSKGISWLTRSNDLERYMDTLPTSSLLSIADSHSSIMFMRAV